ncbi:MAG: hypothetical protein DRO13_01820 [Thermoprotei archaeon]|nr:MAG: hypothetical protein DRO13_01820 [Thermoprotei archaeon]
MSDELPDHLKLKLLRKIMSESLKKSAEEKPEIVDPESLVWSKLSDEKARELMEKAKLLYPDKYKHAVLVFYYLLRNGVVKEFDGYTTLTLLHRLGIPVKPDLRIRFVKRGREVDLKEYLE